MKMQRFANQKCRFGDRIGRAVREDEFCFIETADREADEIEQREQFATCGFREYRSGAPAFGDRLGALRHQDLVQRAAASSSCARASTQLAPLDVASRFQNGALVFK